MLSLSSSDSDFSNYFFQKNSSKNTIRLSNDLDPDQDRQSRNQNKESSLLYSVVQCQFHSFNYLGRQFNDIVTTVL